MSFLGKIFGEAATETIGALGDVAKKFITTDQDRMKYETEMIQIINSQTDKMLTHADIYEQELSARQKNDMASDSWLSKNIRPLMMVFFLTMVSLVGMEVIKPDVGFIEMIKEFTTYGLMFYFGGRSLEKVASMVTSRWQFGKK